MENMKKGKKIELLCPAGSLGTLKAAVSSGADSVYLGMNKFNAREYATNFNPVYLREAIKICKSNDVKLYLTMNTLVKNSEIKEFLGQIKYAYEEGIDSVIIQDPSFIEAIREMFPGLGVHVSTQAGILNSQHALLFSNADRINLARELNKKNIERIRKGYKKEIEMFVHGALCACISGSCLFSSLLGRSGNRGKCAQPCRKLYETPKGKSFLLSTKELCLIEKIPEIIEMGIDSLKIEGRMRTPFYVATATSTYRKAIDSYYSNDFKITPEMLSNLKNAFSREFTQGRFSGEYVFNPKTSTGTSKVREITYEVKTKSLNLTNRKANMKELKISEKESSGRTMIVRVYNERDALTAEKYADIICMDMFHEDFKKIKKAVKGQMYAFTPRIMLDSDFEGIKNRIKDIAPDGLIAGNLGILGMNFNLPVILDHNSNTFNDLQLEYYQSMGGKPIISPELSLEELGEFKNKDFIVFVHGKIRLMTLAHDIPETRMRDEKGFYFDINKIFNGIEVLNEKELGLFNKTQGLLKNGINQIYLDPYSNDDFENVLRAYRNLLDGKPAGISGMQRKYVLGWSERGAL